MHAQGYQKFWLIGSSFGGLITILVSKTHPELHAIGLKYPVPDFPEMLEQEFGLNGIEEWKCTNYIPNVTGGTAPLFLDFSFYESCRAWNAYAAARKISTPVLIVHANKTNWSRSAKSTDWRMPCPATRNSCFSPRLTTSLEDPKIFVIGPFMWQTGCRPIFHP